MKQRRIKADKSSEFGMIGTRIGTLKLQEVKGSMRLIWRVEPGQHDIPTPCVYFWVLNREGNSRHMCVSYVGKAGYGLTKRMKEHGNGFKFASSNSRKRQLICDDLDPGKGHYDVYARRSEDAAHPWVEQQINTYSWDEHALFSHFKKNRECLWLNLAGFPAGISGVEGEISDPKAVGSDEEFNEVSVESIKIKVRGLLGERADGLEWRDIKDYSGMTFEGGPSSLGNCGWSVLARFGKAGKALPNKWLVRLPKIDAAENFILVPHRFFVGKAEPKERREPKNQSGIYIRLSAMAKILKDNERSKSPNL